MKLSELKPRFYKIERSNDLRQEVDTLAEAQGLLFLCPKCFVEKGGAVGTHSVLCWFSGRGVPDDEDPGPGRWEALGTGIADLTFRAGGSSILLTSGCCAHFFIRDGEVTTC